MKEGTLVRRRDRRRKDLGNIRYVFSIQMPLGKIERALVFFPYLRGHTSYGAYEQNIDLAELVEVKRYKWIVRSR